MRVSNQGGTQMRRVVARSPNMYFTTSWIWSSLTQPMGTAGSIQQLSPEVWWHGSSLVAHV